MYVTSLNASVGKCVCMLKCVRLQDCYEPACAKVVHVIKLCVCMSLCVQGGGCVYVSLQITELHEWACTCGRAGTMFLLLRADL